MLLAKSGVWQRKPHIGESPTGSRWAWRARCPGSPFPRRTEFSAAPALRAGGLSKLPRPAARAVAASRRRRDRINCRLLLRRKRERAAHRHAAEHRAVAEILGQEQHAVLQLRRADHHAVPPGKIPALLDLARSSQQRFI